MSRTFRRKNYEQTRGASWCRRGWKTNGYYTECEDPWLMRYVETGYYWVGGETRYRPMTEREKGKEYWRVHRDHNTPYAWGNEIGKWGRRALQKQQRQRSSIEIKRFFSDHDYEPMIEHKRDQTWWYWV